MKIRKINDTTINCIITQDDLKKHGIDLDDLFDRRKNAVEFIRRIILKAASSVNLNIKNDYTSMRISVLPDQSVSLTISQDPVESAKIREHKELAAEQGERKRDDKEVIRQTSVRRTSLTSESGKEQILLRTTAASCSVSMSSAAWCPAMKSRWLILRSTATASSEAERRSRFRRFTVEHGKRFGKPAESVYRFLRRLLQKRSGPADRGWQS